MNQLKKYLAVAIAALLASGATLVAQENDLEDRTLDQLQELIEQFREQQQQRVEERRALANDEEIDDADRGELMRALIEEQAMEQRALNARIRDLMKNEHEEDRPGRRGPPDHANNGSEFGPASEDGGIADDVRALNDEFRAARDQLLSDWRATIRELQNATREERREAFEEFRNARDERFEEMRENRQAIRDLAQERAAGRRPERD